jgi:hypothetical protein
MVIAGYGVETWTHGIMQERVRRTCRGAATIRHLHSHMPYVLTRASCPLRIALVLLRMLRRATMTLVRHRHIEPWHNRQHGMERGQAVPHTVVLSMSRSIMCLPVEKEMTS